MIALLNAIRDVQEILALESASPLSAFVRRSFDRLAPQTEDIVMLGPEGVGKTSILAGIRTLIMRAPNRLTAIGGRTLTR